jgi:signal transduction histidine kinase
MIRVTDNGPGIPKEELSRVFAPFHRMATHRNQPGTGLGLYFAKNLIEAMGGRIGVESQLGAGSTFYVELPAA